MSDSRDEGEWRFELDEVDEDGVVQPERDPIDPGSPSMENVLFMLLGVALALGIGYVTVAGIP